MRSSAVGQADSDAVVRDNEGRKWFARGNHTGCYVCSYGNRNEIIPHRFPDLRGRSSDYDLHLRGYVAVGRYGHTQFP